MSENASKSSGNTKVSVHSMTGFASGALTFESWDVSLDIRSVNGRGLDIRLRAPDWITGLEADLRKLVQSRVARGSISMSVKVSKLENAATSAVSEEALGRSIQALLAIEKAAGESGLHLAPLAASDIASMRGVMDARDDENADTTPLKKAILDSCGALLQEFNVSRAGEGSALFSVLSGQIDQVETLTEKATVAAGSRQDSTRANMERNLARILDVKEMPDETRLLQELAIIAVKADVTEELDRLRAHVASARDLLSSGEPIGRKLDFLMQEFNREANTLCSKAQSTELTAVGLELKAVIDQMREQGQNVE